MELMERVQRIRKNRVGLPVVDVLEGRRERSPSLQDRKACVHVPVTPRSLTADGA